MSEIIELGPSTDVAIWKKEQERKRNTMSQEPKFCNKCGEILLVSDRIGEYDVFTGEKIIVSKTFKCPHYNRLLGRFHFNLTIKYDIADDISRRPI